MPVSPRFAAVPSCLPGPVPLHTPDSTSRAGGVLGRAAPPGIPMRPKETAVPPWNAKMHPPGPRPAPCVRGGRWLSGRDLFSVRQWRVGQGCDAAAPTASRRKRGRWTGFLS